MTAVARPNDSLFTEKLASTISIEEIPTTPESISSDDDKYTETALNLLAHLRSSTRLISSPYTNLSNQLNLATLDLPSQLFSLALTLLEPTTPRYATEPYLESFNWSTVFGTLRELSRKSGYQWRAQSFYVVIFRSKLLPVIDRERLGLLDQRSHEEACDSGGLLKYWFGSPDTERRNLATCLWRKYDDAVAGGKGPWHAQARMAARTMYESISFHTHLLHVNDDATEWDLAEFDRSKA